MKKIIRLKESDLKNIIRKILSEQTKENINPDNLKVGDGGSRNPKKNNSVKQLQQKLMDLGFLKTDSMVPTGYFGSMTKSALDKYNGGVKKNVPIYGLKDPNQGTYNPLKPFNSVNNTIPSGNKNQSQNNIKKPNNTIKKDIKSVKPNTLSQSIESSTNIPNVTGSDRVNKELVYINARPKFNGKPFFLVDPRLNIVYAFDENHKFIDYTQSVAGADKQTEKIITYEEWCNISGLKYDKFAKTCKGQEVRSFAESTKTKQINPSYSKLIDLHKRYQAPGIYQTSGAFYEKGYTGKPGVANLFPMQTPEGVQIPTAIHALVNLPNRVTADAELKKYLNSEKNKGRIPKEYIDAVTNLTSKYDLSSGCFNVDPKFANNPRVIQIAKDKAYVFIMSEKNENYLVAVPPQNQDEFFSELKGDGQRCKSIESIASNLASVESKTSIA